MTPSFPRHIRLDENARLWIRKEREPQSYVSEDGHFEIVPGYACVYLISHIHEGRKGKTWSMRFPTHKSAMEYAERI